MCTCVSAASRHGLQRSLQTKRPLCFYVEIHKIWMQPSLRIATGIFPPEHWSNRSNVVHLFVSDNFIRRCFIIHKRHQVINCFPALHGSHRLSHTFHNFPALVTGVQPEWLIHWSSILKHSTSWSWNSWSKRFVAGHSSAGHQGTLRRVIYWNWFIWCAISDVFIWHTSGELETLLGKWRVPKRRLRLIQQESYGRLLRGVCVAASHRDA